MRIGVTGHQRRPEIDWNWVKKEIGAALSELKDVDGAYTSLAVGSDQIFAQAALRHNIKVIAVIPLPRPDYEKYFKDGDLETYYDLLGRSEVIELKGDPDHEKAFFQAGIYIADHADKLIAVWDGNPALGLGGTADIVAYAQSRGRPILHINPVRRSRGWIGG
jgi:hypothetical protein